MEKLDYGYMYRGYLCKRFVLARVVIFSKEWDMVFKGNSRLNRIFCCMRVLILN